MRISFVFIAALFSMSQRAFPSSVIFRFEGLSRPESKICIDIFDQSESDFFLKPEMIQKRVFEPFCFEVSQALPVYRLDDLKPGIYSAAFFEDLYGDGKIRLRSFLGIPIPESPIGFSQNPMILFGPPSFQDCAIKIGDQPKELTVKMKRIF